MNATVNIVCYKSKTLKNGVHPLIIRIFKDRKMRYQSLGISVSLEHWDFPKNKPKSSCPNKDLINKIILDKELEYQKQILELRSEDKEFSASTLIAPKARHIAKTVHEFYNELIQEFANSNKVGNSRIYNDSLKSLETYYKKKLDVPFSHIDVDFLRDYEKYLRQNGCAETTMNLYFMTLRRTYNKAIEAKHSKKTTYPFDEFKISKFSIKTEKRAISKDDIKLIMNLDLTEASYYIQFA